MPMRSGFERTGVVCAASAAARADRAGRVRNPGARCRPASPLCCAQLSKWKRAAGKARRAARSCAVRIRSISSASSAARFAAEQRAAGAAPAASATQVAAVHVGSLRANRCFELKIGYDQTLLAPVARAAARPRMSAGRLRARIRAHEFLGSSASWQEPFATAERRTAECRGLSSRCRGLSWLAIDGAGFAAGAWLAARSCRDRWPLRFPRRSLPRLAATDRRVARPLVRLAQSASIPIRASPSRTCPTSTHACRVTRCITRPRRFRNSSRRSEIVGSRADGFTFIDLGSGKGRVLLLAAQRSFRRVIGVEVSRCAA